MGSKGFSHPFNKKTACCSSQRGEVWCHLNVHMSLSGITDGAAKDIDSASEKGEQLRARIHDHYQLHDNENKDLEWGIDTNRASYSRNQVLPNPSLTQHDLFLPHGQVGGHLMFSSAMAQQSPVTS